MISAIFLDFDGVIMDSMALKLESYCYALEEFEFVRNEIQELQLEYTGQSRNRVLDKMVTHITGDAPSDDNLQRLVDKFTEHDDASRPKMEVLPGALEFLTAVQQSHYVALVTGTPQFAIDATLEHHNLRQYFRDVCGTPRVKPEILKTLMETHSLNVDECIMVGDGKVDQVAADTNKMRFVGMACEGASFEPASAWKVVKSLPELLPSVNKQ